MSQTQMKLVDHIYYINLDHRKDRLEHILQEITKIPPWVYSGDPTVITRFSAIKHERGFIGCAMSHLAVMKDAREKGYQNVMVLEDDATFVESSTEIDSYFTAISEYLATGAEWDLFFVIANIWEARVIKGHMERHKIINVKNGQAGACYIVNRDYYNLLIANMDDCVQNGKHLDMHWKALQYYHKWYAVYPAIGTQLASYSDIEKYEVNYSKYYNKKYILTYCPELTGNLGQQLFQIFSIYGLAKRYNRDFIIDKRHVQNVNQDYEKFYINYRRTEDDGLLQGDTKHCYENPFLFNQQLEFTGLKEESANVLFHGAFQSPEYFAKYINFNEPEIKRIFDFKKEDMPYDIDFEQTAFIYVDNNSSDEHYEKGIQRLLEKDKNTKFLVIYDNGYDGILSWLRLIPNPPPIMIGNDEKEFIKLAVMKLCKKGGIGGMTALSWWGVYLNENKCG
jgi:glycosyl transferase family 25